MSPEKRAEKISEVLKGYCLQYCVGHWNPDWRRLVDHETVTFIQEQLFAQAMGWV